MNEIENRRTLFTFLHNLARFLHLKFVHSPTMKSPAY